MCMTVLEETLQMQLRVAQSTSQVPNSRCWREQKTGRFMLITLHKNATTTPATRLALQQASGTDKELAQQWHGAQVASQSDGR